MKKLLFISFLFLCSISFGQTKYLIKNNEIVFSGRIPTTFERNGATIYGYNNLSDSIHYADGWRDEERPAINQSLEKYGQRYFNVQMDKVTWTVTQKTAEEIAAEKEAEVNAKDENFDLMAIKRVLQKTIEKTVNLDSLTVQDIADLTTIYPQWRAGIAYLINDKCVYDTLLYRVVQSHTSQSDWTPDITPALFTAFTPPGQVAEWVQPTGAQDAYNIGDKVSFQGQIYESLINANTWSPAVYPAGWKLI
jgi:hypothetical protein